VGPAYSLIGPHETKPPPQVGVSIEPSKVGGRRILANDSHLLLTCVLIFKRHL
jgi:hypothetical protein